MKKKIKNAEKFSQIPMPENAKIQLIYKGSTTNVYVERAKEMLLCEEDEVRFSLGDCVLVLQGRNLLCVTYVGGVVEITGQIIALFFAQNEARV